MTEGPNRCRCRPEQAVKAEALREAAEAPVAEWARKLIEDELIELRDARISVLRRNGLVVYEANGDPSFVIRMGFEQAWRRCLLLRADELDQSGTREGEVG